MDYLEKGLSQRFNKWGLREPLVGDERVCLKAVQKARIKGASETTQSYLFANTLTGVKGLEFVAFSKSKLSRPVLLPNDVILYPCFIDPSGQKVDEPLAEASAHMQNVGTYIYDGWLPIKSTDIDDINNRLEDLRGSFASFSLVSGSSFEWEPKYLFAGAVATSYFLEDDDLGTLEDVAQKLVDIPVKDKNAILRSVSWISRAQSALDDCSKFLFAVLSIESLCNYIEKEAGNDSPLKQFAGPQKTKAERKKEREAGIHKTLEEGLEENPTKAVQDAYFTWVVPIKRMLKDHLGRVMAEDDKGLQLFFEGKKEAGQPSLYEIRHLIAHGSMSNINEADLLQVSKNVWEIEKFALCYVWRLLNKCLNVYNRVCPTFYISII